MKNKQKYIPKRRHKHGQDTRKPTPEFSVLVVSGVNDEGQAIAVPETQAGRRHAPYITVVDAARGPAVGNGDRILAKLRKLSPHHFEAQVVRVLPKEAARRIVGVFVPAPHGGGVIEPVSHKVKEHYRVDAGDVNGAVAGDVVRASLMQKGGPHGLPQARIEERLGAQDSPHAASLIAASIHQLPMEFSAAALAEAEKAPLPLPEPGREDLRDVPLVTIDGEDARDFDDAVFAEPDTDAGNPGGFHLIVAIADVARYVAPESALDKEAFERGNSVYFPDRVIPMLPERLSNGLCSLKPGEDRYCLAVHLWIDASGGTRRYRFTRAIMRSHARLTYTEVEESQTAADAGALVAGLYAAYHALALERDRRGTLAIQLPEYKVVFGADGTVADVAPRQPLESHRLIEAYMVAANVAAANFLIAAHAPGIYRVHERPSEEKIMNLRTFLKLAGYALPKGTLAPAQLNRVLEQAKNRSNMLLVHTTVLRSQMQAYYSSQNLGHYGLALTQYCHFTSPIRRYADLVVHRSLAAVIERGPHMGVADGLTTGGLAATALHISETERLAMAAERDAMDRYRIAFMARHVGGVFPGSITGVNEYGLYVTLTSNGITGFVPVNLLGRDFFAYNKGLACFQSRSGKQRFALGDALTVRVAEANAMRGNLIFKPEDPRSDPGGVRRQKGRKHVHKSERTAQGGKTHGNKTQGGNTGSQSHASPPDREAKQTKTYPPARPAKTRKPKP